MSSRLKYPATGRDQQKEIIGPAQAEVNYRVFFLTFLRDRKKIWYYTQNTTYAQLYFDQERQTFSIAIHLRDFTVFKKMYVAVLEAKLLSEKNESGRNRPRNVAGGAATQTGFMFPNRVAAWIAVRMLAEQDASPRWSLSETITLERLYSETADHVHDLLVHTSAGGYIFIDQFMVVPL